jgi:hypothetical protein
LSAAHRTSFAIKVRFAPFSERNSTMVLHLPVAGVRSVASSPQLLAATAVADLELALHNELVLLGAAGSAAARRSVGKKLVA